MIVIIDYDMGNVGSIANMIKKVGGDSIITRDKATIEAAEKLILPGVGAFDTGMQNIEKFGLLELLNWKVQEKKTPILGVCLGMQLLTESSEEGKLPGLSWIKAKTIKFPSDMTQNERRLTVPHMGWNDARIKKTDKLFQNVTETPRFYFVHSYYVKCDNESDILCETDYGITFTSALNRDNIWGMQFHPEKSHKFGMRLYQCFVNI
jgi:imidazole glycerol-phosphate synthase subunit HisH